jgi:hypothetical protein
MDRKKGFRGFDSFSRKSPVDAQRSGYSSTKRLFRERVPEDGAGVPVMDSWQRKCACDERVTRKRTDLVLLSAESFEIAPCYFVHGVYAGCGGQLRGSGL